MYKLPFLFLFIYSLIPSIYFVPRSVTVSPRTFSFDKKSLRYDGDLHMNIMGQGREPIAMLLNRDLGTYPLQNHIGTFERR